MTQYAFYFSGTRCTGCKTCSLACKDYNHLSSDVAYRKVYEYGAGSWSQDADGCWTTDAFSYPVSIGCQHCDDPACARVCPTGAMHKDAETGLVSVDDSKCIGCGYCQMACPYGAPKVDREKGHSVKCDGCASRVAEGKKPICVEACPLRALDFGTVEEMSKLGAQADIAPLPSKELTKPNLFITATSSAQPSDAQGGIRSAAGEVQNVLEVM